MGIGALQRTIFRWNILPRLGILLGLLFLELAVGWLMARGLFGPSMLLAATVAPVGLLIFYRLGRFEYGILGILLTAGLVNFFTLPTGTESRIVISLMVTLGLFGVWIVQSLLIDKRIQLKPSPINKPLLAFVVVNVIAYVWSQGFRDPMMFVWGSFPKVQLVALLVNVSLPLLALLVSNKIQEVKWLQGLTWITIGVGVVAIISMRFNLPTFAFVENGMRGTFSVWVGALAFSLLLFDDELSLQLRGLLLALLVAWFYQFFVLNRGWLSGWLPMGIACVAVTWMRSRRLFVVVALLGSLYLAMNFDYYWQNIVVSQEEEGSGSGRVELWERNLQHVADHPLFGMGPAGYAIYNMTYHPEDARSTHNNFFDVLAQTGIIGFGVFLWLMATFVRLGLRVRRALAGRRDFEGAFASATLAGCIGALAAMMFGDWVLPFAYNQTITGFDNASFTWVFLGGMVSLYHIVNRAEAPPL